MKVFANKVRTSQLYFNGTTDESANEVVVKCFLPAREVMNHFGMRKVDVPKRPGTVIEDYGFCQMRTTEYGTVEFVTSLNRLQRTIKALQAYIAAVTEVTDLNKHNEMFKIDLNGSLEHMRKVSVERIAVLTGAVYRSGGWYL